MRIGPSDHEYSISSEKSFFEAQQDVVKVLLCADIHFSFADEGVRSCAQTD